MSKVLYRKYRASTFGEVLGQDSTVEILKTAIKRGRIGHAYLFAGPRGTGKTSMARLLTKAVNQENFTETGEIDAESEVSKAIDSGSFLDLIEIDAASNRGIEEIRALREKVNYAPAKGKYKVYIIDEVHMLTREAFNALLKTLEEPPKHVIFILATTEPQKLPVTILSRVQRFNFSLASEEKVVAKLKRIAKAEKVNIELDALKLIYKHSGGSFRDAESLLEKVLTASSEKISTEYVQNVLGLVGDEQIKIFINNYKSAQLAILIEQIRSLKANGASLKIFAEQIISSLKDDIVENLSGADLEDVKLLNGLIQLLEKLSNFDDAQLIFEVFLVNSLISKAEAPAMTEEISEKPTRVSSTNDHEATESNQLTVSERDTDELLKLAKKSGFKIWSLLKAADMEFNEKKDKITIVVLGEKMKEDLISQGIEDIVRNHLKAKYQLTEVGIEYRLKEAPPLKSSNATITQDGAPVNHNKGSNAKMVEEMF